ncbi:MAG: hypothetical protein KGL39_20075, partial [Patescibacteria group bacterium]|nr:hypothetical protein [Patescibacteria group bacterium]
MSEFPREWKTFKKWREERIFATEDQAVRANVIENCMRVIEQLDEEGTPAPKTKAMLQKHIDDFAQELR